MHFQLDDTIVAVASPPGGGVRGIVRLSGGGTLVCLQSVFVSDEPDEDFANLRVEADLAANVDGTPASKHGMPQPNPPRAIAGKLQLGGGSPALSGTLYYWPTARSFTRQPAAEFHTLGSTPLLEASVKVLCARGARLARPGEFTLRAFLAGRLDLTQAEAVLSVIEADDTRELRTALDLAAGGIGDKIAQQRDDLIELLAQLEAGLDFVDEDIEFISAERIENILAAATAAVEAILDQIQSRAQTDERRRVVLVGPPNAGKSSLLNALAGREAALVSNRAGTTRDYLEVDLTLDEMLVRLIDTAGLLPAGLDVASTSEEFVSRAAQEQTAFAVSQADLVLSCQDHGLQPTGGESTPDLPDAAEAPVIHVVTKADEQLSNGTHPHDMLEKATATNAGRVITSAHTKLGLDVLRDRIASTLRDHTRRETRMLTASVRRCSDALHRTLDALRHAAQNTRPTFREELIAAEVRSALEQLGEVTGAFYTDDLLDRIFSRFCIGK